MFPNEVDHHKSSLPANTSYLPIQTPQPSSLQAKANKLMKKEKKKMRKINFKKAVAQKFKDFDQKLEALTNFNISEAFKKAIQARVLTELKKLLPTHIPKVVANYVRSRLNTSLIEDSPNNREGEKKKKRRKDAGQSSTQTSRKDIAPMVQAQEDTHVDQPQDQADTLIQQHSNPGWFTKKSGPVNAMRRTAWFDLLLKLNIDQNEDLILGPSTVAIAKKLKEIIQKDELTIADLKGAGLEKLKLHYKNDVELEYHVDQLKAAVTLALKRSILHLSLNIMLQDARQDFFKAEINNRKPSNVYSYKKIILVVKVVVKRKWGYGFLSSIMVRRSNKQEYTFSYADLPRLSLNGIEGMYLLKVQDKTHHLPLKDERDFNNALLLFIRRTVTKNRDEDLQLGLNEVHKFRNGTLTKIQENLIDMLNNNKLGRSNERLKGHDWNDKDIKKSKEMVNNIDQDMKRRKQLRRLEE
ncbi:hypothetical protein Tco_1325880 [Tanacetum coccineum]